MSSRVTDHRSAPIAAYLDSLSYKPGEAVVIHASGRPGTAVVDLVHLGHDGANTRVEKVTDSESLTTEISPQPLPTGSRGVLELAKVVEPFTIGTWFNVARLPDASAVLLSLGGRETTLRVAVDGAGMLSWEAGNSGAHAVGRVDEHQWYLLTLTVDATTQVVVSTAQSPIRQAVTVSAEGPGVGNLGDLLVEFGGVGTVEGQTDSLDGLIETPFVLSRSVRAEDLEIWNESLSGRDELLRDENLVHVWDTCRNMGAFTVEDSRGQVPLTLHGGPTRSLPGRWWTGDVHDPRLSPEQYGAVHFHTDDLVDARWPVIGRVVLPGGLSGGVYGIRLAYTDVPGEDIVPFVLRSSENHAITVLLPTLTYLAYANEHACPPGLPEYFPDLAAVFARENGLHSWYDRHRDGTPVVLCSLKRPLFGFRHDHQFRYTGSDHGISADLRLLGWLERQGFDVKLITDHDLDREGTAALAGTQCLVTGAHPEYWTGPMLDALQTYQHEGGNLVYLGGNGFVWSVHVDHASGIAEMRRGDVEERPLEGDVGTANFQLSGKRSGLWQTLGRPAANFTGLTAGCMGFTKGSQYEFTKEANSTAAPLLDGIDTSKPFGSSGQVLGAAAAYETDIFNEYLGSSPDCTVIATAKMPDSYMSFAPGFHASPSGEDENSRVRSDIVVWETPYGGLVWSVGSIAWSGALNDDPVVSRMTRNALSTMSQPT